MAGIKHGNFDLETRVKSELSLTQDVMTFQPRVLMTRSGPDGVKRALVHWTPENM